MASGSTAGGRRIVWGKNGKVQGYKFKTLARSRTAGYSYRTLNSRSGKY